MAQSSRKLPIVPPFQFLRDMKMPEKLIFGAIFAGVIALVVAVLVGLQNPAQWSVEYNEVTDAVREQVVLDQVTANYRTLDLMGQVYRASAIFNAGPIQIKSWMVWVLVLSQLLGWPLLLTGITETRREGFSGFWLFRFSFMQWFPFKNLFFFAGLFAFAIFLIFSDPASVWIEGDISKLVSLALVLPFAGLALATEYKLLKLNLSLRFFAFVALLGGLFGAIYATSGWTGLHQFAVNGVPVMVLFWVFYLFWTGSDLTNLLFLLSTNAKKEKLRLPFWATLIIYLGLFLLEFTLLHAELDLGWFGFMPEKLPIRPIHLILLASLVTVITSQNLWVKHREYYQSNAGFSFAVMSLPLLALGTLFAHIAFTDIIYIHLVERLGILFYTAVGLFHVMFLFLNFFPLIRRRVNFYYLTKLPTQVDYFFVIILTVMVSVSLEGREQYKTLTLTYSVMENRAGDHDLLRSEVSAAQDHYRKATLLAKGSAKGNYNRAMTKMALNPNEPDTIMIAAKYLENASGFMPFAPAALTLANIYTTIDDRQGAQNVLQSHLQYDKNPYLLNNLAMLEFQGNKPDSAIAHLKEALLVAPELSAPYANLGQVYLTYEEPELAREFTVAALSTKMPSPTALTNGYYFNLARGDTLTIPDEHWNREDVRREEAAQYNRGLHWFMEGEYVASRIVVDSMLSRAETPEGLLLDAMLRFRQDSLETAITRVEYINAYFMSRAPYANHFAAMEYFRQGVPEMAGEYFRRSASTGLPADSLNYARMELDAGNYLTAMQLFGEVRVHNYAEPEVILAVQRELGVMHKGLGNWLQAGLEWDFEGVTAEDYIRMGRIAAKQNGLLAAQNIFLEMIALDSSDTRPYLEMGKLNLQARDSNALANLMPGLEKDPNNPQLKLAVGRARLQAGQMPQAIGIQEELRKEIPESFDFRLFEAEMALVKKDTGTANRILKELNQEQPLNTQVLVTLGEFYRAYDMNDEGYAVFFKATQLNTRNADLWFYMALFARRMGQNSDAGYCALKAIQFSTDETFKLQVGEAFEEEISLYASENEF